MSRLLIERGFQTTAIEFSAKMADVAHKNCPELEIIRDEFLSHDFGDTLYDGILGVAFIHLFTATDRPRVLQKISRLLRPNGIAYISTTKHESPKEGHLQKTNFSAHNRRFRKQFTKQEFLEFLAKEFKVINLSENTDAEETNKTWMNAVLQKNIKAVGGESSKPQTPGRDC